LVWQDEEEEWAEEEMGRELFLLPLVLPSHLAPLHLTRERVEGGREEEKGGIGKGIEAGNGRRKGVLHHPEEEDEEEEEEDEGRHPWEDRTTAPTAAHCHHSQQGEGG